MSTPAEPNRPDRVKTFGDRNAVFVQVDAVCGEWQQLPEEMMWQILAHQPSREETAASKG